jgi:hypothetical protein
VADAGKFRPVSLLRYSPLFVLIAILLADGGRAADPDMWGHVLFGRAAVHNGHFAWTDTYSYSAAGHPWVNHELWSEAILGFAYDTLGGYGLKLLKLACAVATVAGIAAALATTGASLTIQQTVLATTALALLPQMQYRPQIFSYALLAAMLLLLAQRTYRGAGRLWLSIPMLFVWSNLHGGFIVGVAALGAYTGVTAIRDYVEGRGLAASLNLARIWGAATLATLLTPYSRLSWKAAVNAISNPYTHALIMDWLPLPVLLVQQASALHPGIIYTMLATGLMAAFVVFVLAAKSLDDLPLVAIGSMMVIGAIAAVRNIPIGIIAVAVPLARHCELYFRDRRIDEVEAKPLSRRANRRHQMLLGVTAIALAAWTGLFSATIPVIHTAYPVGAVAFIRTNNLNGNILNDFDWGLYLLWHLNQSNKVFVDGRYDTVYPMAVIKDYLLFHVGSPQSEVVLAKYPHDLVLVAPSSRAYRLMVARPDWKPVYRDEVAVLFARADSPAGRLPEVLSTVPAAATEFP